MKRVGIIGGMSWQSTVEYYKGLNELSEKYGNGFSSIDIIIYSLNFKDVETFQRLNDWDAIERSISLAAVNLERAGADFLIIASNTIHKILPYVKMRVEIPFLSIIDAVGNEIERRKKKKVALFGTRFTMEEKFYIRGLKEKTDAEIIVPEKRDREAINRIIFEELTKNIISNDSRGILLGIIDNLQKTGIDGVILGCTELPFILSQEILPVSVFDSTEIHIRKAFEFALKKSNRVIVRKY